MANPPADKGGAKRKAPQKNAKTKRPTKRQKKLKIITWTMSTFNDLPNELVLLIADYLGPTKDLLRLCCTSKRFHALLIDELYRLEVKERGSNELVQAVGHGKVKLVERWLDAKADPYKARLSTNPCNIYDDRGYRDALMEAISECRHDMVKLFATKGVKLRFHRLNPSTSPLHEDDFEDLEDESSRLFAPRISADYLTTAIDEVGQRNFIRENAMLTLHALLKHGPRETINVPDGMGKTFLRVAMECGSVAVVKALLQAGANPSVKTRFKNQQLDALQFLACRRNFRKFTRFEMMKELIAHGADITRRTAAGETAFDIYSRRVEEPGTQMYSTPESTIAVYKDKRIPPLLKGENTA